MHVLESRKDKTGIFIEQCKSAQNMPAQSNKKAAAYSRACANGGVLEDPSITTLSACARCHLASYCSEPCQAQHWKQKLAGHKQFCVTPEERRPGAAQADQSETIPTPGMTKAHEFSAPVSTSTKCDECAIFFESLDSSSADCCALLCAHFFYVPCAEELRSFGIKQVCPMCRVELPPGPEQLYREGYRLYFSLKKLVERSGGSWARLTTTQRRTMDKAIGAW